MNPKSEYERLKSKSLLDVCMERAQLDGAVSSSRLAQLVYEEKQMEQKFEYEKQQIELQHKLNMEVMTKQVRWIKFSAVLNAIAIIAAVLLGWYLSELKSVQQPRLNPQPVIQSRIEPSTSESHYEQKALSVPSSQPPITNERH